MIDWPLAQQRQQLVYDAADLRMSISMWEKAGVRG